MRIHAQIKKGGGGVLSPLWDFLCGFLMVEEGRVVMDSGKQEKWKKKSLQRNQGIEWK